jgi:thiamine pyrophosphate-dependent acetolactate synthase large subunit-like protein
MQGKTAIANILKQEGVDVTFCFPNNALIDAAAAAGIRPVIS